MEEQYQKLLQQATIEDAWKVLNEHPTLADAFIVAVVADELCHGDSFEGYSKPKLHKYYSWCEEWIKKRPLSDDAIPSKAKKGLELAIKKGWLEQLTNNKYRWVYSGKGTGYMFGYIVGKLFDIEYTKVAFSKSIDDLFDGTKPSKHFNNYYQSDPKKEQQWKKIADEFIRELSIP